MAVLAILWFNHLTAACQTHRGLDDHFAADYLTAKQCLAAKCVSSSLIIACFICILRQMVPFILCCVDPSQSMVWYRKLSFLVSGYKLLYRDTFSNFPSQF